MSRSFTTEERHYIEKYRHIQIYLEIHLKLYWIPAGEERYLRALINPRMKISWDYPVKSIKSFALGLFLNFRRLLTCYSVLFVLAFGWNSVLVPISASNNLTPASTFHHPWFQSGTRQNKNWYRTVSGIVSCVHSDTWTDLMPDSRAFWHLKSLSKLQV